MDIGKARVMQAGLATAVFTNGVHFFPLSSTSTFGELSARLANCGRLTGGDLLTISVRLQNDGDEHHAPIVSQRHH